MSFFDPFGIKRRKREKLERLISPYLRPGDDELTKAALRLALTEKNFGRDGLGYSIIERELDLKPRAIYDLLLKLKDRGIESAARECEFYELSESLSEETDNTGSAEELLAALAEQNKNR